MLAKLVDIENGRHQFQKMFLASDIQPFLFAYTPDIFSLQLCTPEVVGV